MTTDVALYHLAEVPAVRFLYYKVAHAHSFIVWRVTHVPG